MTLTSILPTLRASIPDPLTIDRWPEWTHPTTTDVIVSGVSMLRLVDICDTPCVHIAAAVIPGTHGRPSDREQASVVVARITSIDRLGVLTLDADLGAVPAHLDEVRMIGRTSTRHTRPFQLGGAAVTLPEDVAVGDLVAVPCAGSISCRQLRTAAAS
ncbi:hypothetical protein ITJ64_05055 [Herbiconiux sp. VKM Ac-1786]|uniref:hypothetical protein n=1 Tax=Herbiconiux sp. VKM Ac-1786 TaxID=2783824 RepID=UPI00188A43B2|nr:hypothetical protein [Herbiconiux sp. VKM Ac-1786]MBF4571878.1 hypothetical protein [Herbiconiux sp. VKM Ac-1786]